MDIDTYEMLVDGTDQLEEMIEDLDESFAPSASEILSLRQRLLSKIETKCKMLEHSHVTGIVLVTSPYVIERHDSLVDYLYGIVDRYREEYMHIGKRYGYTYSN